MENATEALMMAFAVFVFVIAISASMLVMGEAKAASDHVFYRTDKTNFYDYYEEKPKDVRIVGAETIVPTIYRYYKENFNVVILDRDYNKVAVYNKAEENEVYNNEQKKQDYKVTYKESYWVGNSDEDAKKRIDIDLSGVEGTINGYPYTPQLKHTNSIGYDKGLLKWLEEGKQFEETFLEQRFSGKEITSTDDNSKLELVKGSSTMWIIYREV